MLTSAGHFLRTEPALAQLWQNPATPKLKLLLTSAESRGVFVTGIQDNREVVRLDEQALRRAAEGGSASAATAAADMPGPSPWEDTAMALTAAERGGPSQLAGSQSHPRPAAAGEGTPEAAGRDSFALTISGSLMTASSAPLTSRASAMTTSGSMPFGPGYLANAPGSAEGIELIDAAGATLPQSVVAAIMAAWPGTHALARLKRRAALALAAAQEGPEGPHSMLASALGDVLHRYEPEAVAELRHPVTKTLRVKQLLHEGGPLDTPSSPSLGSPEQPSSCSGAAPSASPGTASPVLSIEGGSNGPGFLRVIKGKYDIVVALNVPGLLQFHAQGGVGGGTPGSSLAGEASFPSPSPIMRQQSLGALSPVRSQAAAGGGSSNTSPGEAPRTASSSPVTVPGHDRSTGEGAAASPGDPGAGPSSGGPGGLDKAGADAAVFGTESAPELALRAFPGTSAAAQLRRAIVVHLAGLPRRSQLWTHLGIFVASSQAHLWLNPAHRWPKLKAFVLHPDSRGVFIDSPVMGPGASAGLVALDPAALRRAAAVGLAAAITAAWPGHAPLERIRRAAAFTLAFAVRGPAGPYTMLGSALGTAIRKRDKEAFDALAGMGKLSELLDDTAVGASSYAREREREREAAGNTTGSGDGDPNDPAGSSGQGGSGYIVSFKKDQDGYMRLRLEALLQDWPREDITSAAGLAAAGRFMVMPGAPEFGLADPYGLPGAAAAAAATYPAAAGLSLLHGAALTPGAALSPAVSALGGAVGLQAVNVHPGIGGDPSPPLEQELLRRFPNPPGVPATSEQATIAAAKRCIARLLAWAPPPHQLTFAKLGAQVPKLLGGARIGRNLRLICLEEPDVFNVQSQSPTVHVVRLVCPRMLQLAAGLSERRSTPSTPPAAALPQVMQVYMQQQQQAAAAAQAHPSGAALQQQLSGMLALQEASLVQPVAGVQAVSPAAASSLTRAQSLVPQLSALRLQTTPSQRLLLQAQVQARQAEQEAELRQQLQAIGGATSEHGGVPIAGRAASASGPSSWPAGWPAAAAAAAAAQTPQAAALQRAAHPSLASLAQRQDPQQLLRMSQQSLQQLQHQPSLGSASNRSAGGGVSATQLYEEGKLSVGVASPSSLGALAAGGAEDFSMGGGVSARTSVHLDASSLQWQQQLGAGGSSSGMAQPQPAGPTSGGHVPSRLHDFVAAALVAEQALQPPGAAATPVLPATAVHVTSDPYSSEFLALLQHCLSCPQVGLAVQVCGSRPALVSLYAPAAVSIISSDMGVAAVPEQLAPAVYVIDCTPSYGVEGSEVILGTLLASLRGLLEEQGVAKVVHGCEQVRALEVLSGAAIAPLLDTRVLLDAIFTMLPTLPPPPSVNAVAAAAAAGPLPAGGYSSVEATAMAQLTTHVSGLRGVLQAVDLWSDRPELVSVLAGLHFAAHRAELWAAAGRDSVWLSRPLSESQVAVAAQAVHHLPELWAALCEAIPWLAAHAALRIMQHLRSVSPLRRHAQG